MTLYTPKHLSLLLNISQKQLAQYAREGQLRRWTAGRLVRYEIANWEIKSLLTLIASDDILARRGLQWSLETGDYGRA